MSKEKIAILEQVLIDYKTLFESRIDKYSIDKKLESLEKLIEDEKKILERQELKETDALITIRQLYNRPDKW